MSDTGEREMGFEQLIRKVEQAENAIEANERTVGAGVRQLKASWKAAWTPGRIVLAGLGSGLLVGLVEPGRVAASGAGAMRLMSMAASLAGLVAGTSAQSAAEEAGQAAEAVATGTTPGVPPGATSPSPAQGAAALDDERLARAADAARTVGAGP